jgi:hypothetical protein
MKMTQTIAKYPKYNDIILEGTKSTETKQVLKDNAEQTRYGKTKPEENGIQMTLDLIYRIARKQQI